MKRLNVAAPVNVAALDGIPGIMPGIVTVPLPLELVEEDVGSVYPPQSTGKNYPSNLNNPLTNNSPKHIRRMMPCDRVEKKKSE